MLCIMLLYAKSHPEHKEQGKGKIYNLCRPVSYKQASAHIHTHQRLTVFFCDCWINMNSVTKLPSLRHFPTNRLTTLCSVDPPIPRYCLHPHFLCLIPTLSISVSPYFLPYLLNPFLSPSLFCFQAKVYILCVHQHVLLFSHVLHNSALFFRACMN